MLANVHKNQNNLLKLKLINTILLIMSYETTEQISLKTEISLSMYPTNDSVCTFKMSPIRKCKFETDHSQSSAIHQPKMSSCIFFIDKTENPLRKTMSFGAARISAYANFIPRQMSTKHREIAK